MRFKHLDRANQTDNRVRVARVWTERVLEYNNAEWGMIGIRAHAELRIPHGSSWVIQNITSPGLWGIESDSGCAYFAEVENDELDTLKDMLMQLKVESGIIDKAFECVERGQ